MQKTVITKELALNIYHFIKKGKNVHIWVCDNKVNQIKKGNKIPELAGLPGKDKSFMMDFMKAKNYKLRWVSHASI